MRWPLLIVLLLFLSWTGQTAQAEKVSESSSRPPRRSSLRENNCPCVRRHRSGISRIRGPRRSLPNRPSIRYLVFVHTITRPWLTTHPTFVPRRIPISRRKLERTQSSHQ